MCLSSAQTPLYITERFSRIEIWSFSKKALLNSALVIDPLPLLDPLSPKKKKRGHGISGRILTEGIPLPTVYLSAAPPGTPALPPTPQGNDFLFNPEEITYV